ncbi:hypothetical protein THRCLA_01039 [Thraustotheca clavata]|uniref:Nucleolar 27S pre-rRNA processing Urb2/Npa2 C-terminal domain-containing protein n=1 Tax=Thraustotheca clavata TaxID=74557 RepID=A0A1W0A9G3_9STRA|nr:hypothetical protein THRCLA_01039 [Thraustotheca clavata]
MARIDASAVTKLLQWKSTNKAAQASSDKQVQTALDMLQNPLNLDSVEAELNVPRPRLLRAVLEWAVHMATRESTAFEVLACALKQTRSYQLQLSLQSCTQLLTAMTKAVEENANDEALQQSILCVFVHLFENSSAKDFAPQFGVFKPPTDVYTKFMHATLEHLVKAELTDAVSDFMLVILRVSHALQKNQANKKKVFTACKQSLGQFIRLRASLHKKLPSSAIVLEYFDKVINDALFDTEHIHGYAKNLLAKEIWPLNTTTEEPPAKKAKGSNGAMSKIAFAYQEQLFQEIQSLLSATTGDVCLSIAEFIEMLVAQFTARIRQITQKEERSSKRKSNQAITPAFAFWLEMIAIAVKFDENYSVQVHILHRLWNVMNTSDIYRVTEDNSTQSQFHYLELTVKTIMSLLQEKSDCIADETKLMAQMVECSPKILQSHLTHVFNLISMKVAQEESMANCALSLRHLVYSYDAMRLLEDLLTSLFVADDCGPLCKLFHHPQLVQTLRDAFCNVPSGQLETLWRFFHGAIVQNVNSNGSLARLQLVRTVFGVFLQEVKVSQHNHAMFTTVVRTTYDEIIVPGLKEQDDLQIKKQILALLGDLMELTDKTIDMQYILDAIFEDPDAVFKMMKKTIAIKDISNAIDGILKFGATRVRFLTSNGEMSNGATRMASFVLTHAISHWKCITPFLTELGHAASPSIIMSFIDHLCRESIHDTTHSIFLDAGFYEIRPFLTIVPLVFTKLLLECVTPISKSPKANKKAANLLDTMDITESYESFMVAFAKIEPQTDAKPELVDKIQAVLKFLTTIPIPYLPGTTTDLLVVTMLLLEPFVFATNQVECRSAIAKWLENFFDKTSTTFSALVHTHLENWLTATLRRENLLPFDAKLLLSLGQHAAKLDTALLQQLYTGVLQRSVNNDTTLLLLSICLQCSSAMKTKQKFVDSFWTEGIQPRIAEVYTKSNSSFSSSELELFASILHFHQAKHKFDVIVLKSIGKVLAIACLNVCKDELSVSSEAVLAAFCKHYKTLSKQISFTLASFGRVLAAILAGPTSLILSRAFESLLENINGQEFTLVWTTLLKELTQRQRERVEKSLEKFLQLLNTEKLSSHKQFLSQHTKLTLSTLVDLTSLSQPQSTQVLALQALSSILTKHDTFHWHSSDIQLGLLALRPLLTYVNQPKSVEDVHQLWIDSYLLLLRVLRQHPTSLSLYLPHFLIGCNALVRLLVHFGKVKSRQVLIWASNLTRLYGYMIPHSSIFRKHIVYLLTEYFHNQRHMHGDVQETLRPGIYALFDICSKYEKEQLYGTLDATGKVLLKAMDTHYKETHEYTGKV